MDVTQSEQHSPSTQRTRFEPSSRQQRDMQSRGSKRDRETSRRASRQRARMDPRRLAAGLGWFSIGLGLLELLAPRFVGRISGGDGRRTGLIRLYGVREI